MRRAARLPSLPWSDVELYLGGLLAEYRVEKDILRLNYGIRLDLRRGRLEVVDRERLKRGLRRLGLSAGEVLFMAESTIILGQRWYWPTWLAKKTGNPKLAARVAAIMEEHEAARLFVEAARRSKDLPAFVVSGAVRSMMRSHHARARRFHEGDEYAPEEFIGTFYEAVLTTEPRYEGKSPFVSDIKKTFRRLHEEFWSRDGEGNHVASLYMRGKDREPKSVREVGELPPAEVLGALEDDDLLEFERQETLRQNRGQLKAWIESAGFSERETQVYESDVRTNFDTIAAARETGVSEKKARDYRSRYVAKLRKAAGL